MAPSSLAYVRRVAERGDCRDRRNCRRPKASSPASVIDSWLVIGSRYDLGRGAIV